jgi:hypothetical protein
MLLGKKNKKRKKQATKFQRNFLRRKSKKKRKARSPGELLL